MTTLKIAMPEVVSRTEWLEARKQLLLKEKSYTRQGDELAAERRNLPWVRVEKDYVFEAPGGNQSLADLFEGRNQLIVQHFMFGPGWIEAFKKRMGWGFKWVSSAGNDFNFDYGVSFTKEEMARGKVNYNYKMQNFPSEEAPGISVFYRNDAGDVFHTYSTYGRGVEVMMGTYRLLDLVSKGRDEAGPADGMAWVRHHDKYGE